MPLRVSFWSTTCTVAAAAAGSAPKTAVVTAGGTTALTTAEAVGDPRNSPCCTSRETSTYSCRRTDIVDRTGVPLDVMFDRTAPGAVETSACACRSTSTSRWRCNKGCSRIADRLRRGQCGDPPGGVTTTVFGAPPAVAAATVHVVLQNNTLAGSQTPIWATPVAEIARANGIVDPFALQTTVPSLIIPTSAAAAAARAYAVSAPPFAPRLEVRLSGVTLPRTADLGRQRAQPDQVEIDLDLAGSFSLTLRNPDNRLLDSALLEIGKTVESTWAMAPDLVRRSSATSRRSMPWFPSDGPPTIGGVGVSDSPPGSGTPSEHRAKYDLIPRTTA